MNHKKHIMLLLLLGIATVMAIGSASAVTGDKYVSITGNDNNNGDTPGTAYATIQKAYDNVATGGTIHILAGTYQGTGNKNIAINKDVTIQGAGVDQAIIDLEDSGRVFTVNSGTFNIKDLTIENGNLAGDFGGAIAGFGGSTTITNCNFKSNTARYSGAIGFLNGASGTVVNSTFIDNSATINGGAAANDGTLTVTGSKFTGNTAGQSGGAIANSGKLTVTGSDFENNNASSGGAIANVFGNGILTANFNRFFGNNATSGSAIYSDSSSADATLNWWGSNANPSSQINGNVNYNPWLVLSINANPISIFTGGTSNITADLYTDSADGNHQADAALYPAEIPVKFTTNLGNLDSNGQIVNTVLNSGIATVEFIPGLMSGTAQISSQVDNQIRTISVDVIAVTIDIKPNETPNAININSKGVIPVAILTTSTFNASDVNASSVTFGHSGTEATPIRWTLTDVNGDGQKDLLLFFDTQKTGLLITDNKAILKGKTTSGLPFASQDSIKAVPK